MRLSREVFAEELESFLERLDAVAAVRIVATEAGEIERIYSTTESVRDDTTIRRTITSALMSQYNLHVDGWRVQIAHLEPHRAQEPLQDCHLIRLEETVTETHSRAVVDLRYEREDVRKTVTGSAQAPPGPGHRARIIALATIDALRPLLERAGGRPALEALTVAPFAGTSVVLAAVSLATDRASTVRIGSQVMTGSEAEAVVGAVLDAVRRPFPPATQTSRQRPDRIRQFEALRRRYEQMVSAGAGEAPPEEGPAGLPGPDVRESMAEIRPERVGGASPMSRDDVRDEGAPAGRAGGRQAVEDAFYRQLVTTGTPVHIRCRDGYEIPHAVVKDFGTYSLMVETGGVQELVFKHAIITIRPHGPMPPDTLPGR